MMKLMNDWREPQRFLRQTLGRKKPVLTMLFYLTLF